MSTCKATLCRDQEGRLTRPSCVEPTRRDTRFYPIHSKRNGCQSRCKPSIYFFSGIGLLQVTRVSDELPLPILNPVNRDVAVLSLPEKLLQFKEEFGRYYPHAVETQVKVTLSSVFLDLIRIPKADIEDAQKGKPLGEPLP